MPALKDLRKKFRKPTSPHTKPTAPKLKLVPKFRKPKPIEQPWAEQYITDRGGSVESYKDNSADVRSDHIKFQKIHPLTGDLLEGSRTRSEKPWFDKNGKPQYWKQPPDSGNFPYFAPSMPWKKIFADTATPLVVSEGETRSLAGAPHGIPVVGCGGCNGVFEAHTQKQKLHPIFKEVKLKRRTVILGFDMDAESNSSVSDAENAAAKLFAEAGADVRILRLPQVSEKGKDGIDDVIAQLGIDAFKKLLAAAPALKRTDTHSSGIKPVVLCAAEVEDKPMEYLGDEKVPIPLEMLTGLCAHPGEGKTQLSLAIAADGSHGIDTFSKCKIKPFRTICWTNESLPRTLRRRYVAQGGDLKSLFILTGAVDASGEPVSLTLENIPELEQAVKQTRAKLLVIDPIQSFIGAKVDMHRSNEMRPLLDGLSAMAERLKIAVIVVRHLSKMGGTHAVTRALGSVDITAKIRTEYMIGHAPDDARNKALVHSKPGECRRAESLSFDIVEGKGKAPKLVWQGKSQLTLSDITAAETVNKRANTKIAQCEGYLRALLMRGPVKVANVVREGVFDGKTVQRAATRLGVKREGSKQKSDVTLTLPKFARPVREEGQ